MAVAIKRFLVQVKRHNPDAYTALPEALRLRYELAQSQLFGDATDAEKRQRSRQQAAEDLLWVIEHFADQPTMTSRQSYKALLTIFSQQCEVVEGKVTVRDKTGGNCMQNPSDPEATYDGHKGPGYQVQITETCGAENEVQLITAALPQTACEPDEGALVPMLDQLKKADLLPESMLGDTLYTNDENVQAAAEFGVDLIGPVPGRAQEITAGALTIDDFAVDERTGMVGACPAGHQPLSCSYDEQTTKTKLKCPPATARMSVSEPMPDRQYRRRTLRPGVHRQEASLGRAASGTRNRCLQATVRHAVGDRVDQQRFEEPPGSGTTAPARSGKRVSCDLAQAGWLERTASRSIDEAAHVGSRADSKNTEKERNCALRDVF